METLEDIALGIAFGDREFKCPFEHRPLDSRKNKIPPDHENKSGTLGRSMGRERIKVIKMDAPIQSMTKEKNNQPSEPIAVTQYGYSPHHLIPGNEIWNRKDGRIHPLLKWIHEKATGSIVNGDIGYINNAKYNGLDLPSHHKFSNIADWSRDENDQYEYAKGAMDQEGGRQFHDSHKAYSDMVWNALEKINARLNMLAKDCKCAGEFPVNIPKI